MICPHCGIGTKPNMVIARIGQTPNLELSFVTNTGNCTECTGLIVLGRWVDEEGDGPYGEEFMLYPTGPQPRPLGPEVTEKFARDFREASMVVDLSPKASAALSRRLLQRILHEKAGVRGDLNAEIETVIEQGHLPSDLAHDLDMIRTTGNFAAHPIKSTSTGEVVDVEPGEAEGLLDLVEELLDYYFVRPARRAAKRDALNDNLRDAGKPALKEPPASPPSTAPPVL